MKLGVEHETCGVKEFVSKGVAIEFFVLEQCWMQANGYFTRVEAKSATTDQFIAAFLEPRHAQSVVVHVQPFHRKAIGNPRQKDGLDVPGERCEHVVDHVFGNARGDVWKRRVCERPALPFANAWRFRPLLQEASLWP